MGFRPSSGRSLLFAFRVDVTAKRENYALFAFETLPATSLRFSFYRSAVVLSEQSLKGINARPTKQAQPAFCVLDSSTEEMPPGGVVAGFVRRCLQRLKSKRHSGKTQ